MTQGSARLQFAQAVQGIGWTGVIWLMTAAVLVMMGVRSDPFSVSGIVQILPCGGMAYLVWRSGRATEAVALGVTASAVFLGTAAVFWILPRLITIPSGAPR